MTEDRAEVALASAGVPYEITRHGPVGSLEEAAAKRGLPAPRIIKTIVVRRADDDFVFVLVPGGRQIAWRKLRAVLGVHRIAMPDARVAREVTGYERGAITPFGALRAWPVVADWRVAGETPCGESASDGAEGAFGAPAPQGEHLVSIGAGAHGVAATLDGRDLVRVLDATVADVTEKQQ